jgi:hypothetical protein
MEVCGLLSNRHFGCAFYGIRGIGQSRSADDILPAWKGGEIHRPVREFSLLGKSKLYFKFLYFLRRILIFLKYRSPGRASANILSISSGLRIGKPGLLFKTASYLEGDKLGRVIIFRAGVGFLE